MPCWGDCLRYGVLEGLVFGQQQSQHERSIDAPACLLLQPWRSDAPRPLGLATACYEVGEHPPRRCNHRPMTTERHTLGILFSWCSGSSGALCDSLWRTLGRLTWKIRFWPACSTVRTRAASCSSPCRALQHPLTVAAGAGSAQDEQVGSGLARLCATGPAARPGGHRLVGDVSVPHSGTGGRRSSRLR